MWSRTDLTMNGNAGYAPFCHSLPSVDYTFAQERADVVVDFELADKIVFAT